MPMPSIAAVMNAVGAKSQSAAPRIYEFIQDRLYLTSFANQPPKSDSVHYFSVDQELAYIHFYSDFGPNNLCHVIRFIAIMNSKLQHPFGKQETSVVEFTCQRQKSECNISHVYVYDARPQTIS